MHITSSPRPSGGFPHNRAVSCPICRALLIALFCLLGPVLSAGAQVSLTAPPAARGSNFDARAMKLLQQMVTTYSRLPALNQETEFRTSYQPLTPPKTDKTDPPAANGEKNPPAAAPNTPDGKERKLDLTLHLAYLQPNRLILETQDVDAARQQISSRWVSDGKMFWSFIPEKNWYTQDKAPGHIRDFARLPHLNSGCLELLMLMGVNPFSELKEVVDSIQCDGTEMIRGVETEVVVIAVAQPTELVEVRLYIGKTDSLLRRLVSERTPILIDANGAPLKVGDALDELAEDLKPLQPAQPVQPPQPGDPVQPDMPMPGTPEPPPATPIGPVKTRLIYDNLLRDDPRLPAQLFVFTPPPGAKLYRPLGAPPQVDPRSRTLLGMVKKGKTHKIKAPREVNP